MKKIIYGIVNFISVVIIAAAIVVLIMVLLTKPGKTAQYRRFYSASDHYRKHGAYL